MTRLFCLTLIVVLASDLSLSAQQKDPPKKFTNSLGMEFAPVPKGKSWLGGGGGFEGKKEVNIAKDFYLGVYLVTQEEWQKIMGKNPSLFSPERNKVISADDLKRFPVERVSWEDAKAFVKLVNEKVKKDATEAGWEYRLPTEEQWEYACRGGPMTDKAQSAFHFYFEKPTNDLSKELANFSFMGLNRPTKVGSYPPNKLGLFDMHGNVFQVCEDVHIGFTPPPEGPNRVIRGGSFQCPADECRAAYRYYTLPHVPGHGLRLARVPTTGD